MARQEKTFQPEPGREDAERDEHDVYGLSFMTLHPKRIDARAFGRQTRRQMGVGSRPACSVLKDRVRVLDAAAFNCLLPSASGLLLSPRLPDGVRFGVEDHAVEVERPGRGEQEIEVLEGLGEEEALACRPSFSFVSTLLSAA